ncbi:MAG: amidohydrolase family protein, partial [Acidobacteriota bacterium]
ETPFTEAEKTAKKAQAELRDWLDAARHYAQARESGSDRLEQNLELEHLAKVLDGTLPVVLLADAARDIEAAVAFAEEEGLRYAIAGGRDAWKVTELLLEHEVPVILGRPQSLPQEDDAPYDRPYRNAGVLADAGVLIAFGSSAGGGFGPGGPHSARTLPFEAATAVAHGLDADAAVAALTVNPAKILGVDDRLGTVEPGKIANLIVVDGNPLEITTQVRHLVIGGREVTTDNLHRQLYERYRSR